MQQRHFQSTGLCETPAEIEMPFNLNEAIGGFEKAVYLDLEF